jgi:hypothetical protein
MADGQLLSILRRALDNQATVGAVATVHLEALDAATGISASASGDGRLRPTADRPHFRRPGPAKCPQMNNTLVSSGARDETVVPLAVEVVAA